MSTQRMMILRKAWRALALGVSFAAIVAPVAYAAKPAPQQLAVSFSGKEVTITGATPASSVVVFAVCHEPHRYWTKLIRQDAVVAAPDGVAHFTSSIAVPWMSIWAVVDLKSGAALVTTPTNYPVRHLDFPVGSLKAADATGEADHFETGRESVEMLWVRPGLGAWSSTNGLAGDKNEDPTKLKNLTRLATFSALGGGVAAPSKLKQGDFLLVIDPMTMEYYFTGGNP